MSILEVLCTMFDPILKNLMYVGIGGLIFAIAFLSNMVFSMFYNIKKVGDRFDLAKLENGLIKFAVFVIGTALLCVAITALPEFANIVGFEIPDEFIMYFDKIIIVGMFLLNSCQYIANAFEKANKIIKYKEEDVGETK